MGKTTLYSLVYALAAAFVFAFNFVYSLFSHGVTSIAMKYAWLAPIIFGVLLFAALGVFVPQIPEVEGFNSFVRTHAASVIVLVNALLLSGVLRIAGANSNYILYLYAAAFVLFIVSLVMLAVTMVRLKNSDEYMGISV